MSVASSRMRDGPMPTQVGKFEILLPIASGGMATVYLARSHGHGGFQRDVALKLTLGHLRDECDFTRELLEEGKLAVRIRHANVVQVLDVGDDPLGVYLVMDYIEGDTLAGISRRAVKEGAPLPPAVAMRILLDALAGLHAAHELVAEDGHPLQLVHRDFSPQNILVGIDGVGRLADFGIAKAVSRISSTQTGLIKGKIAYMAPEQARGHRVDRRCDVWAAGVLAWEILAGRRLYGADADPLGLLYRIANEEPRRLRDVDGGVHPALDAAVASALTRDVDARCPTAAALARSLLSALRAAGIAVADSSEVAETVVKLIGPKLAERRARAKEVAELRGALSRAANASVDSPTPSGIPAALPLASAPPSARPTSAPDRLAPEGVPAEDLLTTDVNSVSTAAFVSPRRTRKRILAAVAVATVGAAAVALVHAAGAPGERSNEAPAATVPAETAQPAPQTTSPPNPAPAPIAASSMTSAPAASAAPRPPIAKPSAPKQPKKASFLDEQY
jgi:serine/threonine-protein kinase